MNTFNTFNTFDGKTYAFLCLDMPLYEEQLKRFKTEFYNTAPVELSKYVVYVDYDGYGSFRFTLDPEATIDPIKFYDALNEWAVDNRWVEGLMILASFDETYDESCVAELGAEEIARRKFDLCRDYGYDGDTYEAILAEVSGWYKS